MWSFLTCKAGAIGESATEVVTAAQKKIQGAADAFTQQQLKDSLEGAVEQVHEAPDIYVTVTRVTLKEGVGLSSLNCFTVNGVECSVEVKIQGTAAQMAGMVAAQNAGKLLGFLGQGEKAITGALGVNSAGLADKAAASTADAKASLAGSAASGQEFNAVNFDIVLDLEKVAGVEEVRSKVRAVSSSHEAINKIMSVSMIEKYVEIAISKRVSTSVTEWQNSTFTLENAKAKGAELAAAGMAKGGELAEAAKQKGGELAEIARAKAGA